MLTMETFMETFWMLHSRIASNEINKLYEIALRLLYGDYGSTFEELLEN